MPDTPLPKTHLFVQDQKLPPMGHQVTLGPVPTMLHCKTVRTVASTDRTCEGQIAQIEDLPCTHPAHHGKTEAGTKHTRYLCDIKQCLEQPLRDACGVIHDNVLYMYSTLHKVTYMNNSVRLTACNLH